MVTKSGKSTAPPPISVNLPEKAKILFQPARYKSLRGGRGSAKSTSVAIYLLLEGMKQRHRYLCLREFQASIASSSLQLLADLIESMGLSNFYEVQRSTIIGKNGTEFLFFGAKVNTQSIKSVSGISKMWWEEAQTASEESLQVILPSIRTPGSELIFTWNPESEDDPIYKRLVTNPPENCLSILMNWQDNPHWTPELEAERLYSLANETEEDYKWIWEGQPRKISNAIIFKDKFEVQEFEAPENISKYLGADFGFANDASTLVSMFVDDQCLYIEHEAYGVGVELDDMPDFYAAVPESMYWIIRADAARPETISHLSRKGFRIEAAPKWSGSIQDGITFIKSFRKIIIHPRCVHTLAEFKAYSWKVNRLTGDIEPIPIDKNNHIIDAVRYGLSPLIKEEGSSMLIWALLAD